MERQRRAGQEGQAAAAAAALHAALAALQHRGPPVKELPMAPGAWARPSLKAMQAALYLLHHRLRGVARTKKELQHVYPVLEPAQAREFKAAMQAWVGELAAAGALAPDAAKYFVSAYQGSAAHRAVLLLLDLSALALAKELGGSAGPLASLPGADLLQPEHGGGVGLAPLPPPRAAQAASAAQRQLQARLDAVVAAMQRLKQLVQQATGQLAAGQAASGGDAAALAPRVPPLFAGSQAAAKRAELVAELLNHGPQLTAQPEAVGPDSWADLLAAGKGPAGGSAAAAAPAPPATARRLSNPALEAANFAAEGLAADADVLTVHAVLVQRLGAVGAALQAAITGGAAPGSAEVQALLAEAAAYRESLMLSVRQELAAAAIRAEQQAVAGSSSCGNTRKAPAMLQLLLPSLPPRNPVTEGLLAAQQQAAADPPSSSSGGWEPPLPDAVEALRHSMWQRLQASSSSTYGGIEPPAAADGVQVAGSPSPCSPGAEATPPPAGSSSSKPTRVSRLPAVAADSPNLEAMLSHSTAGLGDLPLLADLPGNDGPGSPQQQQSWQPSRRQPLGSPCMAESCASASIMGGTSDGAGAAASRRQGHGGGARPLVLASPTLSAAASFMPHPQPVRFHQLQQQQQQQQRQQQRQQQQQQQPSGSLVSPAVAPRAPSPPLRLLDISPLASPALQRLASGRGLNAGSPPERAGSWRQAEAAAACDTASPALASGGSRRRRAASVTTLTPPRCLDSPLPERPRQEQQPAAPGGAAACGGSDATPVSKLHAGSPLNASTPGPSLALQPTQQRQEQRQLWPQPSAGGGSPGSPLLASCFKSKPADLAQSPFALAAVQSPAGELQEREPSSPRWAILAARSAGSEGEPLGSPRGSAGRRRSAVITTSSPLGPPCSLEATPPPPSRLASGAAGAAAATPAAALPAAASPLIDELLSGPQRFDSPAVSSLTSAQVAPGGGGQMDALRQRLARLGLQPR